MKNQLSKLKDFKSKFDTRIQSRKTILSQRSTTYQESEKGAEYVKDTSKLEETSKHINKAITSLESYVK